MRHNVTDSNILSCKTYFVKYRYKCSVVLNYIVFIKSTERVWHTFSAKKNVRNQLPRWRWIVMRFQTEQRRHLSRPLLAEHMDCSLASWTDH